METFIPSRRIRICAVICFRTFIPLGDREWTVMHNRIIVARIFIKPAPDLKHVTDLGHSPQGPMPGDHMSPPEPWDDHEEPQICAASVTVSVVTRAPPICPHCDTFGPLFGWRSFGRINHEFKTSTGSTALHWCLLNKYLNLGQSAKTTINWRLRSKHPDHTLVWTYIKEFNGRSHLTFYAWSCQTGSASAKIMLRKSCQVFWNKLQGLRKEMALFSSFDSW